jgi:flagellar hook-associated protein 2
MSIGSLGGSSSASGSASTTSSGNTTTSGSTSNSGLTGLSTSGISFTGLVSGLDTNAIIQGLLATDQQKVTDLTNQDNQLVAEQTAFQTLEANLVSLQSATTPLAQTYNGVFDARTATSNNQSVATATASSSAPVGVYSFTVNSLAQAEELTSQGFASADSTVTQGKLQIQVGSNAPSTITIDDTNDTLQGVADAINNLGGDVSASIVNTGNSTDPYQLLLTGNSSGAANAITVTNNTAASGGGATQLNLGTVVQPATDASITIGSGSGALTVTSPTNQVDGAFTGVTLNLLGTSAGQPVSVTVANDTSSAVTAVQNFVTAYNAVVNYVSQNNSYNTTTGNAGVFLGNEDASSITDSINNVIDSVVPGLSSELNNLSQIGITLDSSGNGDLDLNTTTLTNALSGQISGVTPDDVASLFQLGGTSTNPGVQFVYATSATKVGATTPIGVNVTQAATQASLAGNNALAGSISIDGTNNTLSLSVDGQTGSIALAQGTYTPQTLVQQVLAAINNSSSFSNASVQVGLSASGQLQVTSGSYGSNSVVSVSGGTAMAALGFTSSATAHGQNVEGNYVVNGVTEAATGQGQVLTGAKGNANTAGLEVRVAFNAAQVAGGQKASVTVTHGIADQLGQVLNTLLDPVTGRLTTINTALQSSETDIQNQITAQNAYISEKQQTLLEEFANMEQTLAQLKTAGNFVTDAFATSTSSSSGSSSSSSGSSGSSSSSSL